jgi:glutamine synthetase
VDRQQEFVLRTLEERQIRFVRLWFTDVLGTLKSVAVAPAELDGAFAEGIGFDGSAIEGFARASESDMLARPDPSTFQILPEPDGSTPDSARMFCDIQMPDGSPSWADPRYVLRRTLSKAAESGLTFYTHALSMADNMMTFRHVIKELAIAHGAHATFMPKPFRHQPGSGMHTHLSLFEGDRNAFHDPSDELNLSKTARSFIAGLLMHAGEITAVTNQWVNSYKRLYGYAARGELVEAPTYVCWGHANRSALVRVPMYKPGKANSTRVELRSLDSACNPYLAFSVILAAGLKGVEENYELPPGAEDDVWSMSETERRALGYSELPHNLHDALRVMENSELVAETLGEHVFDFFLRNKREEWTEYRAEVSPFELRRYLPNL